MKAVAGDSGHTASLVERDGSWHHLAVTWSAAEEGVTSIYMDGLLSELRVWGARGGDGRTAEVASSLTSSYGLP
jgi:hypothetical protein